MLVSPCTSWTRLCPSGGHTATCWGLVPGPGQRTTLSSWWQTLLVRETPYLEVLKHVKYSGLRVGIARWIFESQLKQRQTLKIFLSTVCPLRSEALLVTFSFFLSFFFFFDAIFKMLLSIYQYVHPSVSSFPFSCPSIPHPVSCFQVPNRTRCAWWTAWLSTCTSSW